MNWSYVAGFLDGEGSITSSASLRRPIHYRVSIVNTHEETIKQLISFLDSEDIKSLTIIKRRRNPKHKPCYVVDVNKISEMIKFLERVEPYCITKKEALKKALEWARKTKGNEMRDEGELERGLLLYRQGKSLSDVRKILNIPEATLWNYAKRKGVSLRKSGWHFTIPNRRLPVSRSH